MNDEATVHYTAMIQQLSFGVNYLRYFKLCQYVRYLEIKFLVICLASVVTH